MQTFLLAQAVVEHGIASSVGTGLGDARYELEGFIATLDAKAVLVGLGIVAVVMLFFWRR